MDEVKTTGGVEVTETKYSRFGLKRLLNRRPGRKIPGKLIVIILVVLVLTGGGVYGWRLRQESIAIRNSICNGRDDNKFYSQLAKNFYPLRVSELHADTLKIKKTKYYQSDPNCIYALFKYSINTGDGAAAKTNLDLLSKAYNPKKGFVKAYRNQLTSLDDAKAQYADFVKAENKAKSDTIYF